MLKNNERIIHNERIMESINNNQEKSSKPATSSFKMKIFKKYIDYKAKYGKGYSGQEPGNMYFLCCTNKHHQSGGLNCDCVYQKLKKIKVKDYNAEHNTERNLNIVLIKLSEYIQGVKYIKIIRFNESSMSNIAPDNPLFCKFRYRSNLELRILKVLVNGKDRTENFRCILGLYGLGIIDDVRECIGTKYKKFSRLEESDTISFVIQNQLFIDEEPQTRMFLVRPGVTFSSIFEELTQ